MRAWRACRGLRAWHARKVAHETEEARRVPAALTARAKQERRRNDKERRLTNRASDWLIVSSRKAQSEPVNPKANPAEINPGRVVGRSNPHFGPSKGLELPSAPQIHPLDSVKTP